MKFLDKSNDGFSLVELMIVVAIIGVLAALAVPKFASFQAKARQAEAKTNLAHIYTLEEAYYGDQELYVAFPNTGFVSAAGGCVNTAANPIGFSLRPCTVANNKVRYTYSATSAGGNTYLATAITGTATNNKVVPNCATPDTWTMSNDKVQLHPSNAILACN